MPYIKRTEPPFVKIRRLLLGYELDAVALSKVLGCSYNTARARLDNPSTLTVGELDTISAKGHVPIDEIRAAIIR